MDVERYKADLDKLITRAQLIWNAMQYEVAPDEFKASVIDAGLTQEELDNLIKKLPNFNSEYQAWYSEALAAIRQLVPHRVDDFIEYYKLAKPPKEILYGTYTVSNYLESLKRTRYGTETIVGPSAALPKFRQQMNIVVALRSRFESKLYDIKTLVQADLFDNELDVSGELLKKGFNRAAGAIAGVVLEGHLRDICERHGLKIKAKPTLADCYDLLRQNEVIDMAQWRNLQYLGDLRNLCDHKRDQDPTKTQVQDLIDGTRKVIKTIL